MIYQNALSSLKFKKEKKFALVGNEPYLKELFIRTAEQVYSDCTLYSFFPEEQEQALGMLESEDLFGDKLLVFHTFNKMKMESFEEAIKKYDSNLILVIGDKARLKARAMTKILSIVNAVECKKFKEYGMEYPSWIRSRIVDSGFTAEGEIDKLIFSRVGPNMYVIAHELEKLFILKADEKVITSQDVYRVVAKTAVSTAYEIFESLLKRDVRQALDSFYSYAGNRDNFIDIVSFLGSYMEKIFRMLLLKEGKFSNDDIADIIGLPKFIVKTRYMPKAVTLGRQKVASAINDICQLNVRLRLFKGDKRILVEKFILDFVK